MKGEGWRVGRIGASSAAGLGDGRESLLRPALEEEDLALDHRPFDILGAGEFSFHRRRHRGEAAAKLAQAFGLGGEFAPGIINPLALRLPIRAQ